MSQLIIKPEHLLSTHGLETTSSVSISDGAPKNEAAQNQRQTAIWPVVVLSLGGVATLAWNGFLLWHTARVVIGWVAGDL